MSTDHRTPAPASPDPQAPFAASPLTGRVNMLDLRRLQTLQRVAARGSFSRAGDELHFTQSAVSQQIASLERDVGVRLLNRNPVSLTEPGRMLCDRYASAVAELTAAEAELASFREGGAGGLRIAVAGSAAARIVPRALAAFTARFPRLAMHVEQLERDDALAALRRGDADVALGSCVGDGPAQVPGVRWIPLTRERLVLAVPSGHRLAREAGARLAELGDERFIHSTGSGVEIDSLMRTTGGSFSPRVVVRGESRAAVGEMVAAGAGVALLAAAEAEAAAGVAAVPLIDPPLTRAIYALALDLPRPSAAVAALLDELVVASRPVADYPRVRPVASDSKDARAGTEVAQVDLNGADL